ncbi:hypothetical protein R6Q59_013261 [Mikania micrantha]
MVSCGVVIVLCNTDKEISDDLGKMKIEDEGILICRFRPFVSRKKTLLNGKKCMNQRLNDSDQNDDTASAPPAWARSDSIHPCRWIDLLLSAFLDPFRQPISLTRTVVSPATLPQTYPFFTIHPVQFTISFHLRHPSRALHPATNHREKNARPRRFGASFFQFFSTKNEDTQSLKLELLEYIASLDRGANASSEQQDRVDQIARKLEAANKVKEPLESNLLNGKWELLTQHLNQSCRQRDLKFYEQMERFTRQLMWTLSELKIWKLGHSLLDEAPN